MFAMIVLYTAADGATPPRRRRIIQQSTITSPPVFSDSRRDHDALPWIPKEPKILKDHPTGQDENNEVIDKSYVNILGDSNGASVGTLSREKQLRKKLSFGLSILFGAVAATVATIAVAAIVLGKSEGKERQRQIETSEIVKQADMTNDNDRGHLDIGVC